MGLAGFDLKNGLALLWEKKVCVSSPICYMRQHLDVWKVEEINLASASEESEDVYDDRRVCCSCLTWLEPDKALVFCTRESILSTMY